MKIVRLAAAILLLAFVAAKFTDPESILKSKLHLIALLVEISLAIVLLAGWKPRIAAAALVGLAFGLVIWNFSDSQMFVFANSGPG